MKKRSVWFLVMAAATAPACSTIFGDFVVEGAGSGAGTTSSTTGSTSSGTTDAGDAAAHCEGDASACGTACVDLQSDGHNCGRCGHDCLYGACMAGVCQPWTVATNVDVATVSAGSAFKPNSQIDADGTYVVWMDSAGVVQQVKAAGGAIVKVMQSAANGVADGPALRNGTVAFVGMGSSSVYTVPEGQAFASAHANIATGTYVANSLTLNSNATVAFLLGQATAAPSQNYLLRCLLDGTSCAPVGSQLAGPGARLHVNTAYAFWASSALTRYDFTMGTTGVANTGGVLALAIDSSNVYWATVSSPTIYSLPQSFTGSTMPQKLASNVLPIVGLAGDGTNVYFGTFDPNGNASLYYVPAAGGSVTTMYTSQYFSLNGSAEGYVVAAGGGVYWADLNRSANPPTSNIMGIAAP